MLGKIVLGWQSFCRSIGTFEFWESELPYILFQFWNHGKPRLEMILHESQSCMVVAYWLLGCQWLPCMHHLILAMHCPDLAKLRREGGILQLTAPVWRCGEDGLWALDMSITELNKGQTSGTFFTLSQVPGGTLYHLGAGKGLVERGVIWDGWGQRSWLRKRKVEI